MKMIIADLDGTLIHHQKITNETLDTIHKLQENGYIFSVATGRHMRASNNIIEMLNIKYPVIYSNGAFIYDIEKDKVVYQMLINEKRVFDIMEIFDRYALDYLLYTTSEIISTIQGKEKLISRIGDTEITVVHREKLKDYVSQGIVKILIIEERVILLEEVRKMIDQFEDLYAIQSQPRFLDIGHRLANKGNALKILADYLNIPLELCLAIGDQENDIKMIEIAKIGVAMGDGDEVLKKAADFVTKSVTENGFTYAIEKFIFSKSK